MVLLGVLAVTTGSEYFSSVRSLVVLPVVLYLPGALTLTLVGVRPRQVAHGMLYVVALSIAWLVALGLLLSFLPSTSIDRKGCLVGFTLLCLALLGALLRRQDGDDVLFAPARAARSFLAGLRGSSLAALAAVTLVVLGADSLNRGRGPGLSMAALALCVLAFSLAVRDAGRPSRDASVLGTLYLISLALLLATSLRGWGVNGHDVKVEYRVFTLTSQAGGWQPHGAFTSYNSCLSITVLPTVLQRLLGVSPPDVFRVVFQLIFALMPVALLGVFRLLLSRREALLAAGLFLAFPTFINDMTMLNRQEMALLFFAASLLTLLDDTAPHRVRVCLFLAFTAGVAVSHYSTGYLAAVTYLLAWPWLRLGRAQLQDAAPPAARPSAPWLQARVVLGASLLFPLFWGAWTGSALALGITVRDTYSTLTAGLDPRSQAAGYALFHRPADVTAQSALATYARERRAIADKSGIPLARAPASCPVRLLATPQTPVTAVGHLLARAGADPSAVNQIARRGTVLLFEGGAVVGALALRRRIWTRDSQDETALQVAETSSTPRYTFHPEVRFFYVLSVSALCVLVASVVLPELSVSYGLLRMYQQALVVVAPAVIAALTAASSLIGRRAERLAACVVVGVLATTSGLLPEVLGGYPPQVNLNNSGDYYDAYYVSQGGLATSTWLRGVARRGAPVVADTADTATLRGLAGVESQESLYPGLLPTTAYVDAKLSGSEVRGVAVVGERILRYAFPVSCIHAGRRVVFAAGDHVVLGPVVSP